MASSKTALYTALAANLGIAATKFVAAGITGSSAMVSEGIHSLVDTLNEVFLLLGVKRSQRPPDARRPFGYGREQYFWSYVVALMIFAWGGGRFLLRGDYPYSASGTNNRPVLELYCAGHCLRA